MGNELSIDSCCGIDGRYKDASSAQAEAALKQSWEVEALESWENLDPITYYQYIETRSHDEEKRHRVLQRILYQQNQKQAHTYLCMHIIIDSILVFLECIFIHESASNFSFRN